MSDTYGSGLSFGAPEMAGGAPAPVDMSQGESFAPRPDAPAPSQPQQQDAGPSFGAGLRNILPGPKYEAPDPQSSALDQSASLLEQRVKRANSIATNPMAQIFAPEQAAAAREFVPKAVEQLQKIEQQKSAIQAGRIQARTLGLEPGEVSDQATYEDRLTVAQEKALKGNMRAFQGIQAVAPEKAAAIAPQVYETVARHLDKAQLAFDSLASMQNEGQYRAKVNQLRQDGTLTDLESLGLKLPPTFEAFSASKASEGRALREARIGINTIGQKLEERNTYQPMEKKEADTYSGRLTTAYGDKLTNGQWGRNGASGTRGMVINGLPTVDALGRGGVIGDKDQRKEIGEDFKNAVPKEDIEKLRAFNRTYQLATTDAKGNAVPEGKINTNPNVQQGISEGLASMLRGGTGGANVGLLKIELGKRGWAQSAIDGLVSNYAGTLNTLFQNADKPYLSQQTQKQIRDVMDVLKTYSEQDIGERGKDIARRAGALGFDVSALGLSKNEAAGVIGEAVEEGRRAQIERMRPYFQAIGGGDGVLQLGAQRPGAGDTALPQGAQQANQLLGAPQLVTPVQQAGQPPSPVTPSPIQPPSPGNGVQQPAPSQLSPQPGGAGQPVTIAGQQVTLPPGISPQYAQSVQRIESSNERDPWKAGNGKGQSASGAFQFINSTWAADKPPGAPDRAKDAAPQQQAEALANRAVKDTASLKTLNLPVNDTNLYVMHNLGAGGGASLLQAKPDADARTVVGETAARNNPMFFRGRPTVATVLQRYADEMAQPVKPSFGSATVADVAGSVGKSVLKGFPPTAPMTQIWDALTPSQKEKVKDFATDNAPAIGSTAGAVTGGVFGGPLGGPLGGAAGGAGGQALKDYLKGNEQSPREIVKQGVLGGVLGVASEARPIVALATRVLGVAGTEAGDEVLKGDNVSAVDAGVKGLAYGLGGEALGRFVSSAGASAYKALSRYTTEAQHELSASAGKLTEARQVMASEPPKLPGADGVEKPNPKFDVAKKQSDEATQSIKDHGQNPDDMVHAYEQASSGVSAGEAAVMRKAANEKSNVSQGYNQLRQDVRDTGVGAPKANQPVLDGPLAQLRTPENMAGKVPEQFRPEAEHAEMLIKALAKNWGEKWQQLQNAGTELIEKRMAFLANGDKPSAKAMDNLFEGVRAQQKAAADYVFGPKRGAEVIKHLESLDQRYAKVMNATQGMKFKKMQSVLASGNTPERRELEKNFREFAKDDPSAIRAFNAMKAGARGDWKTEAQLMAPVIAGEVAANLHGIPTVGAISAIVGGHRLYKMMQGYMNAKVLGKTVTFKDFLASEIKGAGDAAGATGNRAAVQGDNLPEKAGSALAAALP